jgi:hypothetical protein
MRRLPIFAVCLLAMPAAALADVTIHYGPVGDSNQHITIEADMAGNVRAEAGPGQIILIRADGQVYLAVPGDEAEYARMDDYVALLEAHRAAHPGMGVRPPPPAHYVLEPRGEEQVGQWRGVRYVVAQAAPHDRALDQDAVISADPALAEAGRAATRLFQAQGRMISAAFGAGPPELIRLQLEMYGRGLALRVGPIYRLESVNADPVPAGRFAIPSPLLTRAELAERLH